MSSTCHNEKPDLSAKYISLTDEQIQREQQRKIENPKWSAKYQSLLCFRRTRDTLYTGFCCFRETLLTKYHLNSLFVYGEISKPYGLLKFVPVAFQPEISDIRKVSFEWDLQSPLPNNVTRERN